MLHPASRAIAGAQPMPTFESSGPVPEEAEMNRSKLSLRAIMLMSGIGLAAAALGGSQPAAAQS